MEVVPMIVERLGAAISARLVAIAAADTIQTAALAFSDRTIGLLVVCDGEGRAMGVLSKSDLVRHLADDEPADTPLSRAMSRDIVYCAANDDLQAAWHVMSEHRLQNMPVLGADSKPVGVLDIRDALQALLEEEQCQEQVLINYISGVGYR
jgi:CBS domain-containing protein